MSKNNKLPKWCLPVDLTDREECLTAKHGTGSPDGCANCKRYDYEWQEKEYDRTNQ